MFDIVSQFIQFSESIRMNQSENQSINPMHLPDRSCQLKPSPKQQQQQQQQHQKSDKAREKRKHKKERKKEKQ
jgi:hypothetical protein